MFHFKPSKSRSISIVKESR